MKFWKILSNLIEETLLEWRDKFLSYKDLKKQLKLIYPTHQPNNKRRRLDHPTSTADEESETQVSKELVDFLRLLEVEIDKFNAFFVDKEEEYVIRWKELQDGIAKAKDSSEELIEVGREVVDFHGEMILLENYSALNYTGLVKILKKYDKRSGALVRLPFIQKVLQEPFFSTDVLNNLVKECECVLDNLFSKNDDPSGCPEATDKEEGNDPKAATESKQKQLKVPKELAEIETMESMYMKLTLSALRAVKEIRSGSSTVSEFSLPPLQNNATELKNLPLLEQAAK